MAQFRKVLLTRNFFSLWLGQIISEFGDRLNQMALIALVYSKSPGSVMALANLLFFIVVPVFVIGPVAGVYVDRWDRKKIMIIADVTRGLLVLLVPLFIFLDMSAPIYIIVFLMFSATRFFLPSKMAFIPDIVAKEDLLVANSLSNTTRMIATVVGFALAGFIVNWVGHVWGFYLDSVSYFVSAVLIGVITTKKVRINVKEDLRHTKEIVEKAIRKHLWHEMIEGFGYMVKKDKMKIVTSTLFVLMAGTGSIFCVIIVFVQQVFGTVTQDLGILGVFLGAGLFAGTVLYGKYGQKLSKIRTMFACFAACGIAVDIFAFYAIRNPGFIVGGLLIMLVGMAAAPILTCANTLIHILIPQELRGRVFSSMEVVVHVAFIVFMFFTAYISKYISNFSILMISGGCFIATGILGQLFVSEGQLEG